MDLGPHECLREALRRRGDASERHQLALADYLGVSTTETAALLYIGRRGQATPGELGEHLGLTSGGITALLQRLERGDHLARHPDRTDGRKTLLTLSPATLESTKEVFAPLVTAIDELISELSDAERTACRRFLLRSAEITEHHAQQLAKRANAKRGRDKHGREATPPSPGLWA